MKKNQKNDKSKNINAKQIKDIIPSTFPHIREPSQISPPSNTDKIYTPQNLPNTLFEEWPNETETDMNEYLLPLSDTEIFKDHNPEKIYLPPNLYEDYLLGEIKWNRPEFYVKENNLNISIKNSMPNRDPIKFREKVHEKYLEDQQNKKKLEEQEQNQEVASRSINSHDDSFSNASKKEEFAAFRDFFKILDTEIQFYIVKNISRDETDEEFEERQKRENEEVEKFKKEKNKKDKKPPETNPEKIKIVESLPSDISMKDGYPLYFRWIASIFQIIKDRNIVDVNNKQTIWQKIYPQQNGIPIYNKSGKYWVKLYHMGKMRKIEIDDSMPCNKFDEFYMPRCENLEELWPAILTKALIKLYSYKIVSNSFKECGDFEPFYALTGYLPEKINLFSKNLFKMFDVKKKVEEEENKENEENDNKETENKETENKATDNKESENNIIINEEEEEKEEKILIKDNSKSSLASKINDDENGVLFLENALNDENYQKENFIVLCYKKTEEKELDPNKELVHQKTYKKMRELKRLNTFIQKQTIFSTKNLNEELTLKKYQRKVSLKTQNLPIDKLTEELENEHTKRNLKKLSTTKSKNYQSSGNIRNSLNTTQTTLKYNAMKEELLKKSKEQLSNGVYTGLLYSIVELFNNKEFNMNRLLPIDFSDLRELMKNFNTTNVFKQLSRAEKREYIKKLKDIKTIQKEEKTKRIENLKVKGKKYFSIKVENHSVEEPTFITNHTDEEIQMTKKCLTNNWNYPPIRYLNEVYYRMHVNDPSSRHDETNHKKNSIIDLEKKEVINIEDLQENLVQKDIKILKEEQEKVSNKKYKSSTWNKEVYFQLIENDIEQYFEQKEPLEREEGNWVEPNEFFQTFDNFIILYNPNEYLYKFEWDNIWYDTKDSLKIIEENKVLHLIPEENTSKTHIIILFSANADNQNKFRDVPYTIHFLLTKKNDKIENGRFITLNNFFGCEHIDNLDPESEYFLTFKGGIFPSGFYIKFLSDFKIEPFPKNEFFINEGFTKNTITIEHDNLKHNENYLLLRCNVKFETKTKFYIINHNNKDNYLNDFIEFYVLEKNNFNQKKNIEFENLFELDPREYIFIINVKPPYNIESDQFDIDIMTLSEDEKEIEISQTNTEVPGENNTNGLVIEEINSLPPYTISDKYKPNKHFILFKEFVFSGDVVYSMLDIRLRRLKKSSENETPNATIEKNDKKKPNNNKNEENEEEEITLTELIRMKLEIYDRENEIIYQTDFYNNITLFNMIFEGNVIDEKKAKKDTKKSEKDEANEPPSNKPYRIVCYFDETELPEDFNTPDYIEGLSWIIKVFSSDTLGFCEDTSKEDKEKAIIASWEENEPGRAEKAKASRKRFLLEKKLRDGEELTEEEKEFLKEKRVRKTFENKDEEENEKNKNDAKKKPANNNKKNVNPNKKNEEEEVAKPKEELNFDKKISDESAHKSLFIKNFLNYAFTDRLIKFDHNLEQDQKELNNTNLITEKDENIIKKFEEMEKLNKDNEEDIEKKKNDLEEKNKKIKEDILTSRKKGEEKKEKILQNRNKVKEKLLNDIENEEKLKEILNILNEENESVNGESENKKKKDTKKKDTFDLNNIIETYNNILNTGLKSDLLDKVNKSISIKIENNIKHEINKVGKGKEKEKDFKNIAKNYLDDINKNKWNISEEIITQLNNFVDEF